VSVWNRIGDVASTVSKGVTSGATNLVKFGGELLGSGAGVAKFAWDVATAPWNNADEYNGFVQTFKTAANKEGANIVKPLASAGGAIMKVPGVAPALERINYINQEYIREPLTTFNLVMGDVTSGRVGLGGFFDPNEWKKAYTGAQDISFGQSVLNQYRVTYDPKFNIYDPAQREAAFKKSAWGKWLSGGFDLGIQLVGDVSIGAGKGLKALKASTAGVGALNNADAVAQAAEDITKAQYGVKNRFTKVIDDFTAGDSTYALNHPMVKSSSQPGLLAHLLGDSVDRDETALILRSALGDPAAMDELRLGREYITDALQAARGDLSAVDEMKLFSAPDGSGMLPFLNDNPAVAKEAMDNYKSLAAHDEYFAKLMQLGEGGGALTRTTGKLAQGVEDFVAKSRALKFYDKTVGNPKVDFYQPTPFHRMYQKFSWAAGERPAGIVDFNDADSYREVIANVSTAEKLLGWDAETSKKFLDSYIASATPEQRFASTMNLENSVFRQIAKKYGVDEKKAEEIYNNYKGARTSALKSIKDKGFMVDVDNSTKVIKDPLFESQTANFLPLMDFELMDRLLKRNANTINLLSGTSKDLVFHYADILQDAFKAGALLRLGYTIRNGVDSQLRIYASVGALSQMQHLGNGLKNFVNNSVRTPARLIDRYRKVDSGRTLRQVEEARASVTQEIADLDGKIREAQAKLSLNPSNDNLAGKVNTLNMLRQEKQDVYNHYVDVINRNFTKKQKELSFEINTKNELINQALKFSSFEEFSKAISMQGLRPRAWHIAGENFKLDKNFNPMNRLGSKTGEPGLFVGDPEHWESYASGRKTVIEYDLTKLNFTKNPLSDKNADFYADQSGNQGFFIRPNGFSKLKEIKRMSIEEAKQRAMEQQSKMPLSKEEALSIWNESRKTVENKKFRIGTGSFTVTLSDGSKYELDDAFGGPLGDMWKRVASSQNSFERMVDSNTDLYARRASSKGIGVVRPTDPAYFEQWAQTLRNQFGNSAVIQKLAKGESIEDVSQWLRNSTDGRDLRRRLSLNSDEAADYVSRVNGFLDDYLPVTSGLRGKIRDITANDLRSAFKDPSTLPIIHGHVLEENIFNISQIKFKNLINSAFRFLGTIPEDTWARNPLYVTLYRKEAKRRLELIQNVKGIVSPEEQASIMALAHKQALREMKGILFNIERKSNLAAAMKFISPFFSAQENAYKTWMKFAVANPAIVNRGYIVWNSPNRAGLVFDQEGNPVPEGKATGNDSIWLGVPKGLRKIPGLESLTKVGIPKQSLDIIFQGGLDVLYNQGNKNVFSDIFPVGPYVAVPIGEIVKRKPQFEEAFKWALPFGPSKDVLSGFTPAWFNKARVSAAGLDDEQFARSYELIWKTEQERAKRNGLPPVAPEKILSMTKDYWNMRVAANLIMPFAPRFDSPYKFYLDKSREYKRLYGLEADAKFLNDYPDFFSFSASLSSNPAGIQQSVAAVKNIEKYSGLVSDLAKIEPKLIGLIANNPAGYDFSQAAYNYLYNKRISADSPLKFLASQSPAEAQRKNEAEKGWIIFNQFSDLIDNELQNRGLSSVSQNGAEDLKYIKDQVVKKLSIQTDYEGKPIYDPKTGDYVSSAWGDDYKDSDGSKTQKVIKGLSAILSDEKFLAANKNNPTWKSVSTYLDFRKAIAQELAKREVKSIDAKANVDLKYIYDGMVNKLKDDDKMGFAYLYDRFLSQDLVYDKSLTKEVG